MANSVDADEAASRATSSESTLKETSNAKSELALLEWTSCLCLRFVLYYETCRHFYHCLVWYHKLFVDYAKFGCILCKKM